MTDFSQRRAGLLFGAFTADALSLGVHWIYDAKEIEQTHGPVTGFVAPGKDSYHPNKQAGDQGHVGDQTLWLADFLVREGKWNASHFMDEWVSRWVAYDDYVDKATKTTLHNIESGMSADDAASNSDELAGPARSAPLIAFLANSSEYEIVRSVVEQNNLTHRSAAAAEAAAFVARAGYRLLNGAPLAESLRETAPAWALETADGVREMSAVQAIGRLGQSCPVSAALPGVIYLCLKHGEDMETAFVQNAMAGGDSCARALVLGTLLGARHGLEAINESWRRDLRSASKLQALLDALY
ncbi:MAG: ADP-ribosylglycohydrolase family protein [Limisphaerales bacterium]